MILDSNAETLDGMDEDVRQSLEAGFQKHLTKPVNLQRLEAAIRQVMGEGR